MKSLGPWLALRIQEIVKIEDNYERRVCEVEWDGHYCLDQVLCLFDGLTHLKKLTIDLGNLPLPSSICRLKSLKELNLDSRYDSGEKGLPDEICQLVSLEVLVISLPYLRTLPVRFGDLVGLKKIHLNGYGLRSLPSSFRQLHNLTELKLEMKRSTKSIPNEISGN